MTQNEIGKMELAAKKRRERLLAMKRKMKNSSLNKDQVKVKDPKIKFRSYQTENITMKENQMERIEVPDISKHIQVSKILVY